MLYDVDIFTTVRVCVRNVEAQSREEAVKLAAKAANLDELFPDNTPDNDECLGGEEVFSAGREYACWEEYSVGERWSNDPWQYFRTIPGSDVLENITEL